MITTIQLLVVEDFTVLTRAFDRDACRHVQHLDHGYRGFLEMCEGRYESPQ